MVNGPEPGTLINGKRHLYFRGTGYFSFPDPAGIPPAQHRRSVGITDGSGALAAAFSLPNQNQLTNDDVQVLRKIAYAWGESGPGASVEVPALSKARHLRVNFIADEATSRIEGRPVPTWHSLEDGRPGLRSTINPDFVL